jgi:DNA-binding CsgD family transcriptional regulator
LRFLSLCEDFTMLITIDDIAGMASPGWEGCGGLDFEVLEDLEGFAEVLEDDYSEIDELDFADTARERDEPEPEAAEPEATKPIRYVDGHREGSTTVEICERLKNERMTEKNRLEQEFFAILQTYPQNGADLKILMWLACGFSYQQTGDLLGRSEKTVRNAARRLRQFRDHGVVKFLPADQVQTGEALLEPFPKVKSGRPRKAAAPAAPVQAPAVPTPEIKAVTTAEITTQAVIFDLFGQPAQPRKPRRRNVAGVRRARVRPAVPGQIEMFGMAA